MNRIRNLVPKIMAKIEKFEDLDCWKHSRILVKMVYELTGNGAFSSDFSLRDQLRRAAVSTMSNVAEGFGRYSKKEFIRFLEMSVTSSCEVKSICYVALDVGYLPEEVALEVQNKAEQVKALNLGMVRYLKSQLK
jgi:four helix bundle protein